MGKWRWGVILDAGSSGSRVYVYKWKDPAKEQKDADEDDMQTLPKLKTDDHWTKKIRPGISTFGDHPEDVGTDHLKELIDHALSIIPDHKIADTPFFLMATAGMRLLPKIQQVNIMEKVCSYIRETTEFSLPDCNHQIQVIPGETEGMYGWIATNYLLGGFDDPKAHDHGKGHHTYGFLDMGGASAQIAFAPNSTESVKHANDLKLLRMRTLNGAAVEHRVFTTTWLGFGVNQARDRYVDALIDKYDADNDEMEVPDPCLPKGMRTDTEGAPLGPSSDVGTSLLGTGKFDKCLVDTYPLLGKDEPCEDEPCLLNGQHVPAIDFDVNHFIGVSEYWHTTHGVFGKGGDAAYDFNTYQRNVIDFCTRDWDLIETALDETTKASKLEKELKNAQEACFKASWLINVLHEGIGIPRVGVEHTPPPGLNVSKSVWEDARAKGFLDPFQPVDEINDFEVSWTLGPMILYASGQVPPTGEALPVGFGSNVPGIPSDFQYAGSNFTFGISDDSEWADTADEIYEKASSKGGSSFLLFLLVFMVLAFLFRHRERRRRIFNMIGSFTRRRRRPASLRKGFRGGPLAFANKLFGRSSGGYERVMEEGDAAQFELGDVDSDDSDHSGSSAERMHQGRTSGLATPTITMDRFEDLRKSASATFDRHGLAVRTESRERLVAPQMLNAGRRSRASSPTRMKSPLAPAYEHD